MPFDVAEEIATLAEAVDRSRVSLLTEAMTRYRREVVDELAESSEERQDVQSVLVGHHPPAKVDHTEATRTKPGRARGRKSASGRAKSTAMSTPRGSRASALREKASAELRAAFEKQERSLALALSAPPTSQCSEALTPRGIPASTPREAPASGRHTNTTRGRTLSLFFPGIRQQKPTTRRPHTPSRGAPAAAKARQGGERARR